MNVASSLSPGLRTRLIALMLEQEARRRPDQFYRHTDLTELRAEKQLAYRLFGPRGMLEASPGEPGVIYIGRYDRPYPAHVPGFQRKRELILRAWSYADLVEQATLFLSKGGH